MKTCKCGTPLKGKGTEGRCVGCRLRKMRGAEVWDQSCRVCGIENPRMLRRHSFVDGVVVLCANHSALAGRRPLTCAVYLAEVQPPASERRMVVERRRYLERRDVTERRELAQPVDLDARRLERRSA